jgi:hypothetical protein
MVKKRTTRCSVRNAMAKEEDAFAGAGGPSRSDLGRGSREFRRYANLGSTSAL